MEMYKDQLFIWMGAQHLRESLGLRESSGFYVPFVISQPQLNTVQ